MHRSALDTGKSMVEALRRQRRPSLCEVCQQWGSARLCHDCITLFASPQPRCAQCGLRTGLPLAHCGECLRNPPPFVATACAVDYGFPWDQLIARYKFHQQIELAGCLAQLMLAPGSAPILAGKPAAGPVNTPATSPEATLPPPLALLPVPLSADRLATRGYNQSWELTRRLGAACLLPVRADVLLRVLGTPSQAELNRAERLHNLRAAFMVAPAHRPWLAGRHVVLVDDVMTTGATAREAASTLLRAGAASVALWVLARTPQHA